MQDPSAIAALAEVTRDWIEPRLAAGQYWGYLGALGGEVVTAAGLLIHDLPPLPLEHRRRQGHVLNVWTEPEHRRRGYSRTLLEYLIGDARSHGLWRLFLNATPSGEQLYRELGFSEQKEPALVLLL